MSKFDDFAGKMREIAKESVKAQESGYDEMETRNFVINAFLDALGYDTRDSNQVRLENRTDDTDDGSKVDYVISKGGKEIMIVEAKAIKQNYHSKQRKQLSDYFSKMLDVKIAVLTNGSYVKFYSHLDSTIENSRIMDKEPFFEFDLQNISDSDVEALHLFWSEGFGAEEAINVPIILKYYKLIRDNLLKEISEPRENFINYMASQEPAMNNIAKNRRIKKNDKMKNAKKATSLAFRKIIMEEASGEKNTDISTGTASEPPIKNFDATAINDTFPDISKLEKSQQNALKIPEVCKIYNECREALNGWNDVKSYAAWPYTGFKVGKKRFASFIATQQPRMVRILLHVSGEQNIKYFSDEYEYCKRVPYSRTNTELQIELTPDNYESMKDGALKVLKEVYKLNGG